MEEDGKIVGVMDGAEKSDHLSGVKNMHHHGRAQSMRKGLSSGVKNSGK